MTRFRAYTTDSEDSDSDATSASRSPPKQKQKERANGHHAKDAEDVSEGNAMEEEELAQPRRNGHRRYSGQTMDEDVTDVDTDEDGNEQEQTQRRDPRRARFASTTRSPPAQRAPPTDSTIIPWARELGVDAQRLHVMQTSLFRMPEEEAAIRSVNQPQDRRTTLAAALNRKHSRDSEGEGARADARQRASFAHNIDPPPFRPSRKYARVESSASAVAGHEGAFVDAGLALGRSFRVGWGPGGSLVHLGNLCGPHSTSATTANSSTVRFSKVPLVAASVADATEAAVRLLSHQLSNSVLEPDADGIPAAQPSRSLTFASFQALFPYTDRSFEACLFRLGHALFDPVDLRLASSTTIDVKNRVAMVRRKMALSDWLQNSVSSIIDATLRENPGADWAAVVFTLLTGNQIEKATEAAMDGGNVKLASLIAQCPGDDTFRDDIRAQLTVWREQRIDVHIAEELRKIYALLAGVADALEGSDGTGIEQCRDIDLAADLDWKRAFGLQLWFGQLMDASIADVFNSYDRLWKERSASVSPPSPWYAEGPGSQQSPWITSSSAQSPDALYSLIRLYADPACSLSSILTPFSFSPSPCDYRLAWHLYILLSRCLRVRDFADRGLVAAGEASRDGDEVDDDDEHVEGHSPSADLLASSYALQLEQLGMIQEAAFVLLHIEGSAGRVKAIKELLYRQAPKLDDWMVRGLVGSLKLPMAWINEAKAMHALDRGEIFEAYELCLAAGLYHDAHELAVLELAPDAVIRQDLTLLKDLFIRFEGHPVEGWHVGGKVFLEYVDVLVRMPELRDELNSRSASADAASESLGELDRLSRTTLKMIGVIPDVLRKRGDVRHAVAIETMTTQLTIQLDRNQRFTAPMPRPPSAASDSIKLRSFQSFAYQKFLHSVEATS